MNGSGRKSADDGLLLKGIRNTFQKKSEIRSRSGLLTRGSREEILEGEGRTRYPTGGGRAPGRHAAFMEESAAHRRTSRSRKDNRVMR